MTKLAKTIEYLFYLFVFLLPIQTQWIWHYGQLGGGISQYFTYGLYGSEILFCLIIFLFASYKVSNRNQEDLIINYRVRDFYFLFALLFLIIILSSVWAINRLPALYYLIKFIEGFLFLFFIINFKIDFFKTSCTLVLSGLFESFLAIYQFLTQNVWASKWLGLAAQIPAAGGTCVVESDCFRWLRAYGTLPHPNVLAGFLAIVLIFLFVLIFLATRQKTKIFLLACLPIILTGLFFTFSKSAFLALAVGYIFMSLFVIMSPTKKDRNILLEIFFICFAVLGILAVIYKDPVLTRLSGENRLELQSIQERSDYLLQAKQLIKNNWLTGVGLGNYTLADYEQDIVKKPSYAYQPVHNYFLLAAAELGVWGFLILIFMVIEIFRRIYDYKIDHGLALISVFKKFKIDGNYAAYREKFYWFLATTAAVFALLVIMIFDHYLWTSYFGIMLWWLCLGLWLKVMGKE